MGIFEKFKLGFKKSADSISSGLREIIVKKEIDDETLNKIEEFLISSDVGIDASSEIKSIISQKKIDPKKNAVEEINAISIPEKKADSIKQPKMINSSKVISDFGFYFQIFYDIYVGRKTFQKQQLPIYMRYKNADSYFVHLQLPRS